MGFYQDHPYYTAAAGVGTLGGAVGAYRNRDAIRNYDYSGKAKGAFGKAKGAFSTIKDYTWTPFRKRIGFQGRRRRSRRRSRRSRRRSRRKSGVPSYR